MSVKKAKELLEDFANPKKWELLLGHYYRCRGKSDAKHNKWPHEIVQQALAELEHRIAPFEIHLSCKTKEEFYTKLRTLIPDDLFEKTKLTQPEPTEFTKRMRAKYHINNKKIDRIKPGHGSCCTCQDCGYHHDDCKCCDNDRIEACDIIDRLKAEKTNLKKQNLKYGTEITAARAGVFGFMIKNSESLADGMNRNYAEFDDERTRLNKIIGQIQAENKKLRELAKLRDNLLVCYRIGKQPNGKLLDRLMILRDFEQALKAGEK